MAVGVERWVSKAVSRVDQPSRSHPSHGSADMSYDSLSIRPGVALPVTEDLSQDLSNPGEATVPPVQSHINKKRRPSKGKGPPEIRRSSSTPHMHNLALASSGELSPTADKRRNKLGYHRTSVACGHCRRRKIRCLVAQDDPQRRCSNCIRLKKDCNFYPVEQTPENSRPHTKDRGAGAPNTSTPSSPRHSISAASGGDKLEEFRPVLSTIPSSTPTKFGIPTELEIDPAHTQATELSLQPSPYAYPAPIETQWTTPGFLTSSSVAESSPPSSGYWRPSPSTAASTYGSDSNMSGAHTPATMSTSSNMSFHDNRSWNQPTMQPPTRSMSYGNIEGLHQYPNPNIGVQHHEYRRTSPYPYPSSIDTHAASVQTASLRDCATAPLSAPILASQPYGYQPNWSAYSMQANEVALAHAPPSAQWYAEPVKLDQVQEEGVAPTAYNHGNMHAYYSSQ